MARFKISEVFSITNRGIVLGGEITEGVISPGNVSHLVLYGNPLILKIKSIEAIIGSGNKSEVGLLLVPFEENTKVELRQFIGQTVLFSEDS